MRRHIMNIAALAFAMVLLAACGTATLESTPTIGTGASDTPTTAQGEATMTTQPSYPKVGNASDYSWIAGRVTYTKIQGGCTYIITDQATIDASLATPNPNGTITGPIVGGAAQSDTSPPLRDITPQTGPPPTQPPGVKFVASGPGWDQTKTRDGDYVLLFGRLAGPGDVQEMCPGGTAYVVDRMELNP
ncbi:MAG: hypothetical protein ABI670_09920 [Chloroflexota bacterium]